MGIFADWFGRKKEAPDETPNEAPKQSPKEAATPPAARDSGFPYETVIVPGAEAVAQCLRLRKEGTGRFTPVIFGAPDELAILKEGFEANDGVPGDLVSLAAGISFDSFSKGRLEQDGEYYGTVDIGEWPDGIPPSEALVGHTGLLPSKPLKDVVVCKVPTPRSWEVPAYLRFGGWNECPASEEHVALLHRWNDQYGAEIITVTHDMIECTVSRPPTTKDQAMELAREQFIYCPDIVHQGTESLSGLAATLLGGKTWYFWWD